MRDDAERRKAVIFAKLSGIIEQGIEFCETFQIDQDDFQRQLAVGHLIALVDIGHSVLILCKAEKTSDAKVLLRTMFETLLCLRSAVSSPSEAQRQEMEYAVNNLKKLKQAKAGNRYFEYQYAGADLDEQISGVQKRITELQAEGIGNAYRPKALAKKFANQEEYDGMYGSLSEQAHATFEAILERSVGINPETYEFESIGIKQPHVKVIEAISNQAIDWITSASCEMKAFVGNEA